MAGKFQPLGIEFSNSNIDAWSGIDGLEVNAPVLVGAGGNKKFMSLNLGKK